MFRISDSLRSTHGQGGAVVLDIRQGQMFNLNLVGSKILELLKSGHSESEIAQNISHEFDIGCHQVETDVREFIEALKKHRLIDELEVSRTI